MPITSAQIAQLNSVYQNQQMQQMQYAGMIGQQLPPYTGERVMGRGMSVAGAVAAPAAMGGLAIAGMDPISLGLRTGMGAARGGAGLMGAGGAALGAGAAAMVPFMAASYGMEQMMQGAQQQQAMNQMLRNNYRQVNQMGGYGFTPGGMGQIGRTMQGMAAQPGPGGEMTTFEELGRLAQGMSRMGMAQGVRDAREFTRRFKDMVGTLKVIAKEMGTSLEEAQKVMGGMRGVGIFGSGQAIRAARAIRMGSAAGGLATEEVTGMMQTGSQLSRMVGGRGGAGAVAGAEAITNLGVAQQLGIISEEDVYESTGLTGAQGRQAWAQQRLQGSARFLRSRLGQRLVAAMAGEGGQLDPTAVARFRAGGVGTEETMRMAHEGVRRAGGQAGFMRNQGRMRGEVMREFGADLPVMAVRGWLQERGRMVGEVNDREMLGLQKILRQGGVRVGQEELDQIVRQAQELPRIMQERQFSGEAESWAEDISRRKSTRGIEGVKKRLEQARAQIQGALRQAGADFYQGGSEMIDRFVNRLSDTYVKTYRRDVDRSFQTALYGAGPLAEREMRETLGITRGAGGRLQVDDYGLTTPAFSMGFEGEEGASRNIEEFMDRDAQAWREGGWGALAQGATTRGGRSATEAWENLRGARREMRGIGEMAAGRAAMPGVQLPEMGEEVQRQVREFAQVNMANVHALDRATKLQGFLTKEGTAQDNSQLRDMGDQLAAAKTNRQRAAITMKILRQSGRTAEEEARYWEEPVETGLYDTSRFVTEGEMHEDRAAYLRGKIEVKSLRGEYVEADPWKWAVSGRQQNIISKLHYLGKFEDREEAASRYMETAEGRDVLRRGMNPREAAVTRKRLMGRLESTRRSMKGDEDAWHSDLGGEVEVIQRGIMMASFQEMRGERPGLRMEQLTPEELIRLGTTAGIYNIEGGTAEDRAIVGRLTTRGRDETDEDVRRRMASFALTRLQTGRQVLSADELRARRQGLTREGKRAEERLARMDVGGVIKWEDGQMRVGQDVTEYLTKQLGEEGSKPVSAYIQKMAEAQQTMSKAALLTGGKEDDKQRMKLLNKFDEQQVDLREQERAWSVKEMRAAATAIGDPELARGISGRADIREYVGQRKGGKAGRVARLAETLGIQGVGIKEIRKVLKDEGPEGIRRLLSERGGMKGDELEQLEGVLSGEEGGKGGVLGGEEGVAGQARAIQTLRGEMGERQRTEERTQKRQDYKLMGEEIANALSSGRSLPVKVTEWYASENPKSGENGDK